MTKVELAVTKLAKLPCACVEDYIKLVNCVSVIKKHKLTDGQPWPTLVGIKNYNVVASRRNKCLRKLIHPAYDMFAALNATSIFTTYIIWWAYTVYNPKLLFKYTTVDIINDTLLNKFIDWLTSYVNTLNILTEFNKSCKFIAGKCTNKHNAEDVIYELIANDKLATVHMTGGISAYVLATIPDKILSKANFKKSMFSKQVFDTIHANRDYLLGILNQACDNIIKTPVDFIMYVNTIYRSK